MSKTFKKIIFAAMGILGLAALASRPAMANPPTGGTQVAIYTTSATATIDPSFGSVAMSAEPRVLVTSGAATALTFTITEFPVNNEGNWVLADQYIQMSATVTRTGGVQIYTDNSGRPGSTSLFPAAQRYEGGEWPHGGNNPMGLVDSTANNRTLPMVWHMEDDLGVPVPTALDIGTTTDRDAGPEPWQVNYTMYGWQYFLDPGDLDNDGDCIPGDPQPNGCVDGQFDDPLVATDGWGQSYMRLIKDGNQASPGAIGGLYHFGDPSAPPPAIQHDGFGDRTSAVDAVFVGAQFTSATPGHTYQGSITLEAFTE